MINLFELAYSLDNGVEIVPFAAFCGIDTKNIQRKKSDYCATEFIISHSKEKIELIETEIVLVESINPYSKEKFQMAKRMFVENGAYISLYTDKRLVVSENFNEKFSVENISKEVACEFIATVCAELNPVVYTSFSELNPKLKKFKLTEANSSNIIKNFFMCIENLNALEKIIKTLGTTWLFENIKNPNFEIDIEKRKVHQIVQTPLEAIKILKRLKLESYSVIFSELAAIDPNYAIVLANHFMALKKLHGTSCKAHIDSLNKPIKQLIELLSLEKFELKALINYCYRETMRYSVPCRCPNLEFPTKVINELYDYIFFARQFGENCNYELMPRNLELTFHTLRKNSSILNKPRKEEFEAAVNRYKYLEWKNKNYEFRTPIDEFDLFNEGNQLSHCIAGFRDRIIDGSQIIFMRNLAEKDTPFITIEFKDGIILEAKQKFNMDIDDEKALAGIESWLDAIERKMNK